MSMKIQSKQIRSALLTLLGFGTAMAVAGQAQASSSIFAKDFLDRGAQMNVPKMVYCPVLQVMVDPVTRIPIYSKQNKDIKLAKVTAGCSDCPKYDE